MLIFDVFSGIILKEKISAQKCSVFVRKKFNDVFLLCFVSCIKNVYFCIKIYLNGKNCTLSGKK